MATVQRHMDEAHEQIPPAWQPQHPAQVAAIKTALIIWNAIPVIAASYHGGIAWGLATVAATVTLTAALRTYSEDLCESARRAGFADGRLVGQLEEVLARRIASGEVPPMEPLPSSASVPEACQ